MATNTRLPVISVYVPHLLSKKRLLWDYLAHIIDKWDGETLVMGDFNEVRDESECFGSVFYPFGTLIFKYFINNSSLFEVLLGGFTCTWSNQAASKMSKLDRFLISSALLDIFSHISGMILHRNLSNH